MADQQAGMGFGKPSDHIQNQFLRVAVQARRYLIAQQNTGPSGQYPEQGYYPSLACGQSRVSPAQILCSKGS